jgi:hypothetical protein
MKQELRRVDRGAADYYYRRPLDARDFLPAVGVAVGAGLAAFYVAYVLLQRTPLKPSGAGAATGSSAAPAGARRRSARSG